MRRRTVLHAELKRLKCRVLNSHGHVTTLPVATRDEEISAARFLLRVFAERYILQATAKVSEEVSRKCHPR